MPLSKKDNPASSKSETISVPSGSTVTVTGGSEPATGEASEEENRDAINQAIDAAAGAPEASRAEAEALPEKDDVQKAIKEGLTAEDAQTEAEAKAEVVDLSPNAAETPSGGALKAVAGIEDDVERGEAYAREKQARRWATQPVEDEKEK